MDKSNLQKRVAELDILVKKLFKMQESQPRNQTQNASSSRSFEFDFAERLAHSQKALSRVNSQLAQYHRPDSTCPNGKANVIARETKLKGEFRVLERTFFCSNFTVIQSVKYKFVHFFCRVQKP